MNDIIPLTKICKTYTIVMYNDDSEFTSIENIKKFSGIKNFKEILNNYKGFYKIEKNSGCSEFIAFNNADKAIDFCIKMTKKSNEFKFEFRQRKIFLYGLSIIDNAYGVLRTKILPFSKLFPEFTLEEIKDMIDLKMNSIGIIKPTIIADEDVFFVNRSDTGIFITKFHNLIKDRVEALLVLRKIEGID